ncbi:MAG TPA: DUF2505 domain-containing protein [Actinopolymorphaceae bacterium]|jgi:uncharacterized protein YndB with AHSA1/START domain
MDLHREIRYRADVPAVYQMLTDQDFVRRRVEASHALRHKVTIEPDGGGCRTRTHQVLPAEVPDFVKKFVGDEIQLDEVVTWQAPDADGSRQGRLQVDVVGAPVTLRGTIRLVPDRDSGGTGTRQLIDAELKASVPLIGRKIEEAAAPAVLAGFDVMERVGNAWLAERQ